MRHQVRVLVASPRQVDEVWAKASDGDSWLPMAGAELVMAREIDDELRTVRYRIESGLPIREHAGTVELTSTEFGGTEILIEESFRARIWGTGGYLRSRRERALLDLALSWGPADS